MPLTDCSTHAPRKLWCYELKCCMTAVTTMISKHATGSQPRSPNIWLHLDLGWRNTDGLFSCKGTILEFAQQARKVLIDLYCPESSQYAKTFKKHLTYSPGLLLNHNPSSPSMVTVTVTVTALLFWMAFYFLPFFSVGILKRNGPYTRVSFLPVTKISVTSIPALFFACLLACFFWNRVSWIPKWPCMIRDSLEKQNW